MTQNQLFDKILFIGPNYVNHRGGIGAILCIYAKNIKNFNFIPSYNYPKNNIGNILYYIKQLPIIIFFLISNPQIELIHVLGSHSASIFRKFFIIKIGKIFFSKKIIYHVHSGKAYDDYYNESPKWRKVIIKQLFIDIDYAIFLSNNWKEFMPNISTLIAKNKISIINNCIEPISCRKINKDTNIIKFIYLGMMYKSKGFYDLLEALKLLLERGVNNFILTIGGTGDMREFEYFVRENGLKGHIEYMGWLNDKEKNFALINSDILVLPSHSEGMPMVILEAMNHGLGIIATNVGGIPTMINNNGILIEPKKIIDLSKALEYVCFNGNIIDIWSKNSLLLIKSYYPEKIIKQLQTVSELVLTTHNE